MPVSSSMTAKDVAHYSSLIMGIAAYIVRLEMWPVRLYKSAIIVVTNVSQELLSKSLA